MKKIIRKFEERSRSNFNLNFDDTASQQERIFFLTPDYNVASGGIKVIYNHVDILNKHGIPSFVLHFNDGFRCDWFDNETHVTSCERAILTRNDVLVVPEVDADYLLRLPTGLRHLVFNQNTHLTWQRIDAQVYREYPARPEFLGFLTVSRHNKSMLEFAYPDLPVSRIHLGIDSKLFYPGVGDRPRRITYMPRRGKQDALNVIQILRSRGRIGEWEIRALDGLSHSQIAEELRSSRIYLAFTTHEGFGLPAAEAMACGNYVIGNHGFGGAEFFRDEFSHAIACGDTVAFAKAVEEAVLSEEASPGCCAERGRLASRFIRSSYSVEKERYDVTRFFSGILNSAGSN